MEIRSKRKKNKKMDEEETEAVAINKAVRSKRKKMDEEETEAVATNKEVRSKRSKRKKNKKMDEEETEAAATNKAVRSKRKKKKMMNRFLSHLFASRSAIKKKMNKEETETVASNKAVRSKRKKKKMHKEETEVVALRTSNQVRNYLNHDIAISILSKLPLKSFIRFECVCKSWATLFEDSYFKTIYTKNLIFNDNNRYDDTYLIPEHSMGHAHFYLLPGQRFEDRVKIDWPSPFQEHSSGIYILGNDSINGILCLNQYHKRRLVLCNPTTGESKVIPYGLCEYLPPGCEPFYQLHGFGYDHVRDDYKVIQSVSSHKEEYEVDELGETCWMIYSLNSNSWRKLDVNLPNHFSYLQNQKVYTNGVCHWWGTTYNSPNMEDARRKYLSSFNFSNELMSTTPSPSYLDDRLSGSSLRFAFRYAVHHCLVLLNESIALISTDLEMATVQISILGELGVRESWTKLVTVTCLPFIGYTRGVGNLSTTVLFQNTDNKLAWVNLNTKKMEELDVKLESNVYFVYVGKYKKSFLPIGGMNN